MCQMSLELSFITVYNVVLLYLIPMNGTILIYFKLVRYVKQMTKNVTLANTLLRAERELKMIRRIVILVSMLITFGLTYAIFIFMSFFTQPPKYHFRIAYIFVNVSLVFILIALFKFTDPIKTSIMKITNRRPNVVIAILT
ncbi:unnamed protein product [Adineta steineri]|nr:unnamed protein product [Adineta steineri]